MIGVIGGSGLYEIDDIKVVDTVELSTPFGNPSDKYVIADVKGSKAVFLPRHGKGHKYPPHLINYRANIWGFRKLGVNKILSISAVGGINPVLKPGDFVIVEQFLDFTKSRPVSFYEGIFSKDDDTDYDDLVKEYMNTKRVVHIDVTSPFCSFMKKKLDTVLKDKGFSYVKNATYVTTEGPRLETAAEIKAFSLLGSDIVGMTLVPEVVLARELNIHFVALSVVTNPAAGIVGERLTSKEVVEMMHRKNQEIKQVLLDFIPNVTDNFDCSCEEVLLDAAI
ncbi:MAG: S-methyl-5'-thioinosine phosphorylase [Aquificae bacterium]|nr:S-methyl-5'-thioinosine phosphorylase [Aquificota bacterium]